LTESQSRELAHLLSAASDLESIAAYAVETEVVEKLKRIYYFAKRMAKTVAQANPGPTPAVEEAA
jgi:phosphate:Na+ symporter